MNGFVSYLWNLCVCVMIVCVCVMIVCVMIVCQHHFLGRFRTG